MLKRALICSNEHRLDFIVWQSSNIKRDKRQIEIRIYKCNFLFCVNETIIISALSDAFNVNERQL